MMQKPEKRELEQLFTSEQLSEIKSRESTGKEQIGQTEAEWPKLIAQVKAEMYKGTDPTSDRVRQLAARWFELLERFTGADSAIHHRLHAGYDAQVNQGLAKSGLAPTTEMIEYIARAREAGLRK